MKSRQPGSTRKAVQIVVAAGVALGAVPAGAASDIFLKIPDIPGESTSDKHKNEIDVLAFSLQVGPRQCPSLSLIKNIDRATPALTEAASTQRDLQSATLSVSKLGDKAYDYYRVSLSGVVTVMNEDQSFSAGGGGTESVSLSAQLMTIGYRPQKADGSFDAEVTKTIACSPNANPGPPANPGKPPGGR